MVCRKAFWHCGTLMVLAKRKKFVRCPVIASLCGLAMRIMVGTIGGGVYGDAREVNKLSDVVVILQPMHHMCVACQALDSCVL